MRLAGFTSVTTSSSWKYLHLFRQQHPLTKLYRLAYNSWKRASNGLLFDSIPLGAASVGSLENTISESSDEPCCSTSSAGNDLWPRGRLNPINVYLLCQIARIHTLTVSDITLQNGVYISIDYWCCSLLMAFMSYLWCIEMFSFFFLVIVRVFVMERPCRSYNTW